MSKQPLAAVDFSALKRRPSRLPPPPEDASSNLTAPEIPAPVAPPPVAQPPVFPPPVFSPSAEPRRRVAPYVAPQTPPAAHDGRSRLRTGRTEPFSTRVRADFRARLIALADRLECTMAEALELAVAALEREQRARE